MRRLRPLRLFILLMDEKYIRSLIQRRRLQILVHSYIYYEMDENIIEDWQWSKWAFELVQLQEQYPDIADSVVYSDMFKNFDGSTGHSLEFDDATISRAHHLLDYYKRRTC